MLSVKKEDGQWNTFVEIDYCQSGENQNLGSPMCLVTWTVINVCIIKNNYWYPVCAPLSCVLPSHKGMHFFIFCLVSQVYEWVPESLSRWDGSCFAPHAKKHIVLEPYKYMHLDTHKHNPPKARMHKSQHSWTSCRNESGYLRHLVQWEKYKCKKFNHCTM